MIVDLSDRPPGVLVVGAGFVGSHIVRRLLDDGHAVRTLTRSQPEPAHLRLLAGAEITIAEAMNPMAVEAALDGIGWVVFGAGGLVPAASQSDPIHDVVLALQPLLTVLEAIRRRPGTAFTYLSSGGTVYGQTRAWRIREDHPTDPITAYGVLKLTGEKFITAYAQQHDFPIRILRIANVYGDGQRTDRGQGAVAAFLKAIRSGDRIDFYGDGGVVRDFIHVTDVAAAAVLLRPTAGDPDTVVVNVGSGAGTSLAELLHAVEDLVGARAVLNRLPARRFDVQRNVLDTDRLISLCGLEPVPLRRGLSSTVSELVG